MHACLSAWRINVAALFSGGALTLAVLYESGERLVTASGALRGPVCYPPVSHPTEKGGSGGMHPVFPKGSTGATACERAVAFGNLSNKQARPTTGSPKVTALENKAS